MTKHTFSKATVYLAALALCASLSARAQETNTLPSVERMKMESLWFGNTSNVAGMYLDGMETYSITHFYFDQEKGNFKRVQSGDKDMKIGFHAEGGGINQRVGGFYLWGKFDYYRNHITGARFNANLVDPFRGSSFYIADPDPSDWLNHRYDLQFNVSTKKLFDFMVFGLDVSYGSDMASKQVDARGNFFAAELELRPGVAFSFGRHALGLNFEYVKRRDTSEPGLTVAFTTLNVAEMQFPGFFRRNALGVITGGPIKDRDLRAHSLGGGAQYNYNGDAVKLLLSGNYSLMVENAYSLYSQYEYNQNLQQGSNIFTNYNGKLNAIYNIGTSALLFNAEYRHKDVETVGITQEYDNSQEVQQWITKQRSRRGNVSSDNVQASLEYMLKKGNAYSWLVGVEGRYEKLFTEYYIPLSTEKVNSMYADIYLKKNFLLNEDNSLVIGISGGIKNVSDKSHDYHPFYPDNIFYKEFTLMDYAYLSSGYVKGGAELSYTYGGFSFGNLYVSAAVDYVKARKAGSELLKNRTLCNFKLGMVF
jgi:hypothetical protein